MTKIIISNGKVLASADGIWTGADDANCDCSCIYIPPFCAGYDPEDYAPVLVGDYPLVLDLEFDRTSGVVTTNGAETGVGSNIWALDDSYTFTLLAYALPRLRIDYAFIPTNSTPASGQHIIYTTLMLRTAAANVLYGGIISTNPGFVPAELRRTVKSSFPGTEGDWGEPKFTGVCEFNVDDYPSGVMDVEIAYIQPNDPLNAAPGDSTGVGESITTQRDISTECPIEMKVEIEMFIASVGSDAVLRGQMNANINVTY